MSVSSIGGNGASLRQLQGPAAYNPAALHRRTAKPEQAPVFEIPGAPTAPARPTNTSDATYTIPKGLAPLVADVQQFASEMGYLDVSPKAVVAAYQQQKSFLVDIRA